MSRAETGMKNCAKSWRGFSVSGRDHGFRNFNILNLHLYAVDSFSIKELISLSFNKYLIQSTPEVLWGCFEYLPRPETLDSTARQGSSYTTALIMRPSFFGDLHLL